MLHIVLKLLFYMQQYFNSPLMSSILLNGQMIFTFNEPSGYDQFSFITNKVIMNVSICVYLRAVMTVLQEIYLHMGLLV